MNALFTTLVVLIILASILLILVVLLQNGKGDGFASNFVAGNQTFGVRQTADLLEKITWGLICFIAVVSIVASFSTNSKSTEINLSDKIENVQNVEFPVAPTEQASPEE
ncbi:MAG: preprotein translocase subunit SecG [Candidatus Cryptobacteroides sp.]